MLAFEKRFGNSKTNRSLCKSGRFPAIYIRIFCGSIVGSVRFYGKYPWLLGI
jgi:hypothetical protein